MKISDDTVRFIFSVRPKKEICLQINEKLNRNKIYRLTFTIAAFVWGKSDMIPSVRISKMEYWEPSTDWRAILLLKKTSN